MVKSGVEVVKGRDILGMPVVIEGQGAEVGKVVDLVICGCFELEAVILESGRSMYVVSMDDLTIGRGILLIKGISSLKPLAPGDYFTTAKERIGVPVLDSNGCDIGLLSDVVIEPEIREIRGIEVSAGVIKDFVAGREEIPLENVYDVGEAVLICEEEALS